MITLGIFLLVVALFVFMYHYERNGDPFNTGDFWARVLWGLSFALGVYALSWPVTNFWALGWYVVGQFIAMLIPHAFAMNAGKRTQAWIDMPRLQFIGTITLPKYWPAFWLKPFLPYLSNTQQDLIGMATVGLLRGLIVFMPPVALGAPLVPSLAGWLFTMAWQPLAYLAGRFTPMAWFLNTPYSAMWGEFYTPIGWAFSVGLAVWL
jgi:hypothetical protein